MVWDADGREALMDYLIAQGIKGIDKAVLAEKVGLLYCQTLVVRLMCSSELLSRRSIMN
jgi:hypothetical protein